MASIEIKPDLSEDDLKVIGDIVMKDERFRPFRIEFTPPYDKVAFFLEHGTGPAKVTKKEPARADGYTAKERIGAWTESRYRGLSKTDLRRKKEDLYHQIMESGTPPRPFIRPAVEDVLDYETLREIFEGGGGTKDIAQELLNRMTYYLALNKSLTAGGEGDSIVDHIKIVPFKMGEEPSSDRNVSVEEILTTWEALDDQNATRHSQYLAKYRSKKARR